MNFIEIGEMKTEAMEGLSDFAPTAAPDDPVVVQDTEVQITQVVEGVQYEQEGQAEQDGQADEEDLSSVNPIEAVSLF